MSELEQADAIAKAEAAAEKRGYARGYTAGRKKTAAELEKQAAEYARMMGARRAFWASAYCAIWPHAGGWKWGEKAVTTSADRAKMAAELADDALVQWDRRG